MSSDEDELSEDLEEDEEDEEEERGERRVPPPMKDFPCGICSDEVKDEDEGILCESGCNKWYHRQCTGMSKNAYDLLTREDSAEWACDTCISNNTIPMIKLVPVSNTK